MDHHLPTTTPAFPAPAGWRLLIFQGLSTMAYLIPGYDPAVLHPPSDGPAPGGLTELSHGA